MDASGFASTSFAPFLLSFLSPQHGFGSARTRPFRNAVKIKATTNVEKQKYTIVHIVQPSSASWPQPTTTADQQLLQQFLRQQDLRTWNRRALFSTNGFLRHLKCFDGSSLSSWGETINKNFQEKFLAIKAKHENFICGAEPNQKISFVSDSQVWPTIRCAWIRALQRTST